MAYQSLYRRFRPHDFAGIIGQEHTVAALRNAVRDDRVGHAYLLSGPRGTGKTTSARVLAKALNCENLGADGEPDSTCASCLSIDDGTSFDLHELDAASNNKVDDMRDLLARVALGTPGRTKVYLLDEVHMLTAGAENALLKTLEEPPAHVVFVLATTEPHKVVATIRSRTQHLELRLVGAEQMAAHVRWVAEQAELMLDDATVEHVVRVGGGSVRDTLSALEQVVSAGGVDDADTSTDDLVDALADGDTAASLSAVADATTRGLDPRVIGEALIDALRDVFLEAMGVGGDQATDRARERAAEVAERMTPARITRALELVGSALIEMRQAADPRIDLEVALVRLTRPDADTDVAALTQRVAELEKRRTDGPAPAAAPTEAQPATAVSAPAPTPEVAAAPAPPAPPPPPRRGPADEARRRLESPTADALEPDPVREADPVPEPTPAREADPGPEPTPAPDEPSADEPTSVEPPPETQIPETQAPEPTPQPASPQPQPDAGEVSLDRIEAAWRDRVLDELSKRARSRYAAGTWVSIDGTTAVFSLPNEMHRSRCEELVPEVAAAVSEAVGTPVSLQLIADDGPPPPRNETPKPKPLPDPADDDSIDLADLVDADADDGTVLDRVAKTFPGAELVKPDDVA